MIAKDIHIGDVLSVRLFWPDPSPAKIIKKIRPGQYLVRPYVYCKKTKTYTPHKLKYQATSYSIDELYEIPDYGRFKRWQEKMRIEKIHKKARR